MFLYLPTTPAFDFGHRLYLLWGRCVHYIAWWFFQACLALQHCICARKFRTAVKMSCCITLGLKKHSFQKPLVLFLLRSLSFSQPWQSRQDSSWLRLSSRWGLVCVVWSDWTHMNPGMVREPRGPHEPHHATVAVCAATTKSSLTSAPFWHSQNACGQAKRWRVGWAGCHEEGLLSIVIGFGQLKQTVYWLPSQLASWGCLWLLKGWKRCKMGFIQC